MQTRVFSVVVLILAILNAGSLSARRSQVVSGTPSLPFDPRLTVHTLLREDVFAGILSNDMDRLARAEGNAERLLVERKNEQGEVLAWKGAAHLYRAVVALKAANREEYDSQYAQASNLIDEAKRAPHKTGGVEAVIGGSFAVLADRLAPEHRASAWTFAYADYRQLWAVQEATLTSQPPHIKGELLAGLAQTAQRTGHEEEAKRYLARIADEMPGTAYAARARDWQGSPETAATSSVVCQGCHEPGRLAASKAALPH